MDATIDDFKRAMLAFEENVWETPDSEDFHGVTTARIQRFSLIDGPKIKMNIILPWGENHTYTLRTKKITRTSSKWYDDLLERLDLKLHQFDKAEGEQVPVGVRYYSLSESGDIKCGTKINQDAFDLYDEATDGEKQDEPKDGGPVITGE